MKAQRHDGRATCVVTFPVTFTNEPVCTVETESSTKTFSYSKTATALTLTSGAVSTKYDIQCIGLY
jgi:hypothetical protein